MNENNLNAAEALENEGAAEMAEVVQPQDINGDNGGESRIEDVAEPQTDIDSMTDEEFLEYIKTAQEGEGQSEVQAENTPRDDTGDEDDSEASDDDGGEGTAAPSYFKTFSTQEEYQGEIDRIVSKRYGDLLRKNKDKLSKLESLGGLARDFYGGDNDEDALDSLRRDLVAQNAEKRDVDEGEYIQTSKDAQDARKWREAQEQEAKKAQQIRDIQEKWKKESEELALIVPNFSFEAAMRDKTFYDGIVGGMSVASAYLKAQQTQKQSPQESRGKKQRRSIMQNGASAAHSGRVELNVDEMSDSEFEEYIRRIQT